MHERQNPRTDDMLLITAPSRRLRAVIGRARRIPCPSALCHWRHESVANYRFAMDDRTGCPPCTRGQRFSNRSL